MGFSKRNVRPLEARVNLDDIEHNVAYLKSLIPGNCRFMAVVKANGYGHGDIEVSRASLDAGADCLGVALVEEAVKLRRAGFDCPLYLLFEPAPEAADLVVEHDIVCSIYTGEFARALSTEAGKRGMPARVHIKVDTGMRRVGIDVKGAGDFAELLGGLPGVEVEGICTHFAVADKPDNPFTDGQMDAFEAAAEVAEKALGRPLVRHAANSAAVLAFARSHYDMVRVGIAMYGLAPSALVPHIEKLRPALSLVGEVVFVKKVAAGEGISYGLEYAPEEDTCIATIPIGYADGLSRLLSGKAEVLVGGGRRPVVGTICMDLCMVDLGGEPVPEGTPVVVIGRQDSEEITVDEVAGRLGTINYEVVCMISSRVPRVHTGGVGVPDRDTGPDD